MEDSPTDRGRIEEQYAAGAALWAFGFAGISFFWAAGGTYGAWTVGKQIADLAASNPGFYVLLWVDALVKTLLGLLALGIAFPSWRRALPGGSAFPPIAWISGLAMALYGGVELAVTGISALLMVDGILPESSSVDWPGILGHLALWDPYWILGGVLFLLAGGSAGTLLRGRLAGRLFSA